MKFVTSSLLITILISFSVMINAAPMGTKRQDQSTSFEIQRPTKDSTWVAGRSETITWETTNNNPVDIMLSKEGSSDAIVVAKDLNGFQGSYVYSVPTSLFSSADDESSSKWKIIIKSNDQIFSTSDDFIISATTPTVPVNSVPPSAMAMSENHWQAQASISLIHPDGEPLSQAQPTSSAISHLQIPSLSTLLLLVTLSGFFHGL